MPTAHSNALTSQPPPTVCFADDETGRQGNVDPSTSTSRHQHERVANKKSRRQQKASSDGNGIYHTEFDELARRTDKRRRRGTIVDRFSASVLQGPRLSSIICGNDSSEAVGSSTLTEPTAAAVRFAALRERLRLKQFQS